MTGVLRELVDGYYRVLARGGFAEPPSAARANDTWLKRANVVASFVYEALTLSDAWRRPATEAWASFERYCDEAGVHEHRPSRPTFCERLGELGGQRRRGGSYARFVYHARKHIEGVDDLPPVLGDSRPPAASSSPVLDRTYGKR